MVMIARILSLFATRAGMVAIALVVGYLAGHRAASNGEAMRRLQAEALVLQAELEVNRAAADAAEREADRLRSLQDQLQEKLDEYETALAARGEDNTCRLDSDDIDRLRKLR